jgi:hypothetical protein
LEQPRRRLSEQPRRATIGTTETSTIVWTRWILDRGRNLDAIRGSHGDADLFFPDTLLSLLPHLSMHASAIPTEDRALIQCQSSV